MNGTAGRRGRQQVPLRGTGKELFGFETASGDVSSLASLVDAVRAVAEESVSVADARTELDAALPGTASEGAVLRVRSGA